MCITHVITKHDFDYTFYLFDSLNWEFKTQFWRGGSWADNFMLQVLEPTKDSAVNILLLLQGKEEKYIYKRYF